MIDNTMRRFDKKGQLFALELKELSIGFLVGFVVTLLLVAFLIWKGIIPMSILETIAPAAN